MKLITIVIWMQILILFSSPKILLAQSQAPSPCVDSCAGPTALLSVLDRPTISDSVCSVKKNKLLAELGYNYEIETGDEFHTLTTLPQPEIRYGTGHNIELKLFPPNYIYQSKHSVNRTGIFKGYSDAGLGIKYEFGYGEKWGAATDTAITFPSGTNDFSSNGTGVTLNSILAYNVNADIGIGFQLGLFHLFNPVYSLQETSVNPIVVVSDQLNEITEKLQIYAECYNAIDIMHDSGITSFIDAGVQYLLSPNVEVDLLAGHNLTDIPYNNTTYFGFGTGIEF
ncbi:MAG: transporter [Deltaproteobacteria bacterium]|nr:transporter [Deltaproteobacteria bacterium]MCL5277368.1 transporter [Deltaproteobacteria bacterium]